MPHITLGGKNLEVSEEQLKEVEKVLAPAKLKGITLYKRDGTVLVETDKLTVKEAVMENKTDLREADLGGADLYGANLYGADLYGADLYGANLGGADLREANLREADLYGANLYGADLYGADLRGAELCAAKFYGMGGTTKIKKSQLNDFLTALGIIVE